MLFARSDVDSARHPVFPEMRDGVLVVEDEGVVSKDLTRTLTHLGYRVTGVAATGEEAIQKACEQLPDLVLMDIRLRGNMDGIRAAEIIRARRDLPVVYLTAYSDPKTLGRAVRSEPLAYLVKPIHEGELQCAIEVALSRHRSELAAHERELAVRSLSLTDELTGLHNRRGFVTLALHQVEFAHRYEEAIIILFVDVDGLKSINDRFGHVQGDRALRDVADVLRKTFLQADILGRLGGDEFAVLLSPTKPQPERAIARLRDNLNAFNAANERPVNLEISVGAALQDASSKEGLEALLARADAEMYRDKMARRGNPVP